MQRGRLRMLAELVVHPGQQAFHEQDVVLVADGVEPLERIAVVALGSAPVADVSVNAAEQLGGHGNAPLVAELPMQRQRLLDSNASGWVVAGIQGRNGGAV